MKLLLAAALLLADGRALFVAKCASCHNERGDKPLDKGPPLAQRKLTESQVAGFVKSRLSDATPEERRAVTRYILSFMGGEAPRDERR